jgi:hypothetical protein
MKSLRFFTFSAWIAMAFFVIAGVAWAQTPPPADAKSQDAVSNTLSARCRITLENQPPWLSDVCDLLHVHEEEVVLGPVHEILGPDVSPEEWVHVECERRGLVGPHAVSSLIAVELRGEAREIKPMAMELLAAIGRRIEARAARAAAAGRAELEKDVQRAAQELETAREAFLALQQLQREILDSAGLAHLSREHVLERIRSLDECRLTLEMELAGVQARRQALQEQIARIGQDAEKAVDDEIASELERVVALRGKELERVRALAERGQASDMEVGRYEEEWATAKVQLLTHREEARHRHGGDLLHRFNEELATLSIEAADMEARMSVLNQQCTEIKAANLLGLADRYEREVKLNWEPAFHAVEEARARLREASRALADFREPKVTVTLLAD